MRRWLCKWCGLYYGPEGWHEAKCDMGISHESIGLPGGKHGVWQLEEAATPGSLTPKEAAEERLGGPVNPWRY